MSLDFEFPLPVSYWVPATHTMADCGVEERRWKGGDEEMKLFTGEGFMERKETLLVTTPRWSSIIV